MKVIFGVDIGGTNIKIGRFTPDGELLEKWSVKTDLSDCGKKIIPQVAGCISENMAENNLCEEDMEGIGMGIRGPVDKNGYVKKCANLNWNDFNPVEELKKFFPDCRVRAGNDANVASLGEYFRGAGKGSSSMMMVTLGTGVGGGVIIGGKIIMMLNSSAWFNPSQPLYSIGLVIYIALIIVFAYFYTSITFNPLEVANNMKKQGGFIPGIRPGKPTSDYLNNLLNYLVFIGAVGLTIVCIIPIMVSGLFNVGNLSFGGTSLIIIVSVTLETLKAIESQMLVRNYKGFLND